MHISIHSNIYNLSQFRSKAYCIFCKTWVSLGSQRHRYRLHLKLKLGKVEVYFRKNYRSIWICKEWVLLKGDVTVLADLLKWILLIASALMIRLRKYSKLYAQTVPVVALKKCEKLHGKLLQVVVYFLNLFGSYDSYVLFFFLSEPRFYTINF